MMVRAKITGTGSAVPEKILTNFDLERLVDTSDEWITTRTGIKERHVASDDEYTSCFATGAARNALEMAGADPSELDLIIVATVTPDFPFPATACIWLLRDTMRLPALPRLPARRPPPRRAGSPP